MKADLKNELRAKLLGLNGQRLPEGTVEQKEIDLIAMQGIVPEPLVLESNILEIAHECRPKQISNANLVRIRKELMAQHDV